MQLNDLTGATLVRRPGHVYAIIKRMVDVLTAIFALAVLSPLLIPVMIVLKLTGEHEVFYLQDRIGYKNRRFRIWKFATMLKISPSIGTGSLTVRNDPRVLPVGKYLRATKINELPQIVNVLIGDMSVVGPRPQMEVDFNCYSEHVKKAICSVKPGITGIGSVVFRDEQEMISNSSLEPHEYYNKYIAPYKGELEVWYLQNRSLQTDTLLVFLTAWSLVFPASRLPYRIFKSLPSRPKELAFEQEGQDYSVLNPSAHAQKKMTSPCGRP